MKFTPRPRLTASGFAGRQCLELSPRREGNLLGEDLVTTVPHLPVDVPMHPTTDLDNVRPIDHLANAFFRVLWHL